MQNMTENMILKADSYKHSHFLQYPPGTEKVYSYIESRGGKFDKFIFFGLQAYLKKYLCRVPTLAEIETAKKLVTAHGLQFNEQGWKDLHELGYWPVEIRALPEGSVVPTHIPCLTIENTDPRFAWVTSFLETTLLRAIWYPSTVATISWHAKQTIRKYLKKTCDVADWETSILPFRLHDFGARGVSSDESASLGGLAHLVNFMGTDTMVALVAAIEYYNAEGPVGFSIPAAEHSTITSWGPGVERETLAYQNMIDRFAIKGGLFAVVSDSYNLYDAVETIWGKKLKAAVVNSGATLVVRPDSGKPEEIVVWVLNALGAAFGFTTNKKGYKVLPSCVRVIQGDGINLVSIGTILAAVERAGWSTENLAMGMGGMLLQGCNRDDLRWAMKTSNVTVNGVDMPVNKDPKTDPGKASKKGKFAVCYDDDHKMVCRSDAYGAWDLMAPAFKDGQIFLNDTFDVIRYRSNMENGVLL